MNKKNIYKKIIINLIVIIILLISIKYFLPYIMSLFLPFILAYIIAKIANPLVKFLEKKIRIKRKYSSILIIGGVLSGIISIIYIIVKTIILFIMEIVNNVSIITNTINDITLKVQSIINNFTKIESGTLINNFFTTINSLIEQSCTKIIESTGNLISFVPLFLLIFIITVLSAYFMIKEDFTIRLSYFENNKKFKLIKKEIIDVISNYLKGQFKIMFIIFSLLTIGFGIMGIKYFVLIALLTAFVDLLPIFGTGTILYPWIITSLLYGNYQKALILFTIYIITLVTRQVLQPKIISTSIGLEPLPTLFLMFIGFKIWGVSGLLLAPPIGLILIKLYKIGIFDDYKKYIKYIYKDLKKLLSINDKNL